MILDLPGKPKLTYCLNVHPGEGWSDQLAAVRGPALELKRRLNRKGPFGLGLRISARGLADLADEKKREEAGQFFNEAGLDPYTFNGFPFGTFHGARVKETVYQPDWKTRERVEYTLGLAKVMAGWTGEGRGSISTVPATFAWPTPGVDEEILMSWHLAECAAFLHELREEQGADIVLGLEPEPACFIENTSQFLRFYQDRILVQGRQFLEQRKGFSAAGAETVLRRHLGICFDTCHAAIQFENIEDSLRSLRSEGISIAKIQISNALEIRNSGEARKALEAFVEPVYLHQVRAGESNEVLSSWTDLPEGLLGLEALPEETLARIHFHVPLFWAGSGILGSTQETLTPGFWKLCREGVTEHLEMETYTFSVLPEAAGKYDLTDMLEREYCWVLERMMDLG